MATNPDKTAKAPTFHEFPDDFTPDDMGGEIEPVPAGNVVRVRDADSSTLDPEVLQLRAAGSRLGKALGGVLRGVLMAAAGAADPRSHTFGADPTPADRIPDHFMTIRYVSADGELMWLNFLQGTDVEVAKAGIIACKDLTYIDTVRTNTLPRSPTWELEFEDPQAWPLSNPEYKRMLPNYSPAAAAIRAELIGLYNTSARSAAMLTSIIQEH